LGAVHIFFFFNDTATTEIYPLSLHDALPIYFAICCWRASSSARPCVLAPLRSEEHTSELQSLTNLVCRLLLEKKKNDLRDLMSTLSTHAINDSLLVASGDVQGWP